MGKLIDIIRGNDGMLSSTRVGKLGIIAVWIYCIIMWKVDPGIHTFPPAEMTWAVIGALGFSSGQKYFEVLFSKIKDTSPKTEM